MFNHLQQKCNYSHVNVSTLVKKGWEGGREYESELYTVNHFSYLLGTSWDKWIELDFIKRLPYTLHIHITHFICTITLLKESYLHLTDSKRENQVDQGPRIDLIPRTFHCPLGRSIQTLERQLRHWGLEESQKRVTACFMQETFLVFQWCDLGSSFQLCLYFPAFSWVLYLLHQLLVPTP